MKRRVCIAAAVNEELAGIKGSMKIENRLSLDGSQAWQGSWAGCDLVLLRTGVGKLQARRAFQALLENCDPSLFISIGYAGGAQTDLRPGDLFLAQSAQALCEGQELNFVQAQSVEGLKLSGDFRAAAEKAAQMCKVSTHRGDLLSVEQIVYNPDSKQALGRLYDVSALDMETFYLASLCRERSLPFFSLRAISDAADEELLNVSPILSEDGKVSYLKAGWFVLKTPGVMKDLMQLRQRALGATENMTVFLRHFLQYID
ncbi:MAG: hypothetical protein G3M78_14300 [Candidatus Nitrohelix vancouverensis]|uniref:Nucleoside phosphorylase domain-containing protein n=1 Tax=Candidatus Nitrohelix vancouverensis TaxID=2705534 RepID=A0A7T0C4T9_9BACT|nr:MAG: hypothetical protein G3M78_14300 [Candidatus Nitrohelix vancouverensis]